MGLEVLDNYECKGQMSIEDFLSVEIPEKMIAVSKIFARARKEMNLPEFKAFIYALTHIKFTSENENRLLLDKKTLAAIVGVNSDPDHLSEDLKRSIGQLPKHSFIEIDDQDHDFYESGVLITNIRMYKNNASITFNPTYMSLFSNIAREKNFITMWSGDIFSMKSERSIEFYEQLRLNTDDRKGVNQADVGIRWFKELFNIPKEGKGSYMREKGGFDRNNFERKVIDPLCEDLAKCRMINLIVQEDGKYYQKLKRNGRVEAYRFNWTYTSHPQVASAAEVKQIQERVDRNPQVLKVARDVLAGEKKPKKSQKKNSFNNFNQRDYDFDELERAILNIQDEEKGETV
jgi:plasmid replication initiation protein